MVHHERPIRIVLVDDHNVVRSGLRVLIEQRPTLQVVGEAETSAKALELVAREQPDVIVLDLDLGGESGVDLIPALQAVADHGRILVLTGVMRPEEHQRAIRLGAVGLVQKTQAVDVLIHAIERVAAGEAWLDPALIASVLIDMSRGQGSEHANPEDVKIALLTEREREVIALICEGLQNRSIGERLSITETTVRHHLTSIFNKLGVDNRLELVIYAYRNGLAELPH
jgi:DNA-binding NarL/FixJ family response regulator